MVCILLEIINMKKLFTILLCLAPLVGIGQYVQVPTHYDAEHTASHILKGHIKMYLNDTVKFTTEKKNERYVTDCGIDKDRVKARIDKVFVKGKPEYSSRTNGGYLFTIAVVDPKDEVVVLNYVTFHVDAWTQKIVEVEILLGQ